jgi:hypothetical protein
MIPEEIVKNWAQLANQNYRITSEHGEDKIILTHPKVEGDVLSVTFISSGRGEFIDIVAHRLTANELPYMRSLLMTMDTLLEWKRRKLLRENEATE